MCKKYIRFINLCAFEALFCKVSVLQVCKDFLENASLQPI